MNLRSLGYQTDLIFPRFDGIVRDRGDYLVIETPSNPGFHWGNFLLFSDAPRVGDLERWKSISKLEFAHQPAIRHIAFGWDSTDGALGCATEFTDAGFSLDEQVVLTAQTVVSPPHLNSDLSIRPLSTDEDWRLATEIQIACREVVHNEDSYRPFKERQMKRYRTMSNANRGHWFGAYIGEEQVGNLGIFTDQRLGRFQNVATDPRFRKRGVCQTLVHEVSQFAFSKMAINTLVMVADDDGDVRRVYESVGFAPTEKQCGVSWWA